jgi:glycosyltransferase involved in cell wall biosynthesis
MRIAVAMGTYQGERYLEEQLATIVAQTRPPDALYVSDDASADDTLGVLKRFAETAPFPVEVITSDGRLGVTHNYERVIAAAEGDVIVLSDQDDRWLPHRVERIEREFAADDATCLTFSDAYLINSQNRRTGDRLWAIAGFSRAQQKRMRRDPFGQLMGRSIVSGCTLAFRAECRRLLVPFPQEETASAVRVFHDRWISIVLAVACGVTLIEEPLVEYRIHPRQRVGIPALQIRKLVPSSLLRWRSAAVPTREHTARLEATIALLSIVRERVDAHLTGPPRIEAMARVEEAIAHLRAREAIDGSRLQRLPAVLREALTGRYHRYSLGTASAAADLVRAEGDQVPSLRRKPRQPGGSGR